MSDFVCRDKMNCQECPKAVDNAIMHAYHPRGFHLPVHKCEENIIIFLLKGEILINSKEYAGTTIRAGEFFVQAIGSNLEVLVMADTECVCYRFSKPELFCEDLYNHIIKEISPPLIYTPLKIVPELRHFLAGAETYLSNKRICRDLLSFKRKELGFILSYYYSDYELSSIVHPLSKYTTSFHYFVLQNYLKVKTVEEFAHLGGYTPITFRRIFDSIFHEPVYEWMLKRRIENIIFDLHHTEASISEVCYKYSFESLPHFSNFCKKYLGASPRNLRNLQRNTVEK